MSAKWTFWAWEQPIKTAPKKLALLQLANNADDDGKSWYSIGKMATACGVAGRTFQRQIQSLEDDGLLVVERRSNRPSIYVLKDEVCIKLTGVTDCQGDAKSGQGDSVTRQSDIESPHGVSESRTILTVDPINDPDNKSNSRFSEFWDLYAKKTDTKKCETKFKKLTKAEIDLVFEKLPAYIASTPDKQYRKNPITWLNGKCWSDDIQSASPQHRDINKIGKDFSQPPGFTPMVFGKNGERIDE